MSSKVLKICTLVKIKSNSSVFTSAEVKVLTREFYFKVKEKYWKNIQMKYNTIETYLSGSKLEAIALSRAVRRIFLPGGQTS